MVDQLNAGQLKQLHTTFQILDGTPPPGSGSRVEAGRSLAAAELVALLLAARHHELHGPPPRFNVLYVRLDLTAPCFHQILRMRETRAFSQGSEPYGPQPWPMS
jgi:hypothetical protein